MGGACSAHGRYAEFIQKVWSENLEEKVHLEDLVVDGILVK